MADSKFIWMDGELTPYDKAQIHVLSHSLHYGGAVFEGMRAYPLTNGKTALFRAEEHFQRLFDSMRSLGYPCRYSMKDLIEATRRLIQANEFKECYVRPIAYINDTVRGLKLPEKPEVHVTLATWNWGKYLGAEALQKGVRVKTSTFRRPDVATSFTMSKLSGPYLYSVMARREATQGGYDEALLLDPQGFVAEGSGENLFMVKGGVLCTPPLGYVLPGITRDSVLKLAAHLRIPIQERNISRNELYLADEVFFTGTAAEITPIRELDHREVGKGKPGEITQTISDLFFRCTRGEVADFSNWLTTI